MSDDPVDPPASDEAAPSAGISAAEQVSAEEQAYPWDADPPPDDPDAPRQRHDAFTEAKKNLYLKALVKTGCILDACRKTGVSPRTVYRHQEGDPAFFEHCRIALSMSGAPVELTAWKHAVEGTEQQFACGGQVHVRRRYDGGLLRLLLQGSNPKKYGPRPGFKRKRLLKHERQQIERQVRAEIAAKRPTFDDAMEQLDRQLQASDAREAPKRFAAGWTKSSDGHWVPPGYAPIPGWQGPRAADDGADAAADAAADDAGGERGTPRDSM